MADLRDLGAYVYRLIDSRSLETFYVGKGRGDRARMHAKGDRRLREKGKGIPKLERIRAIRKATGREPTIVIHRHGLSDKEAYEVEAALLQAYPGLTNRARGHGSERGAYVLEDGAGELATFTDDEPCLALAVHLRLAQGYSAYDAARFCWPLRERRRKWVKYVLAVRHGTIVGVFVPTKWLLAQDMTEFPEHRRRDLRGLSGFRGRPAPKDVQKRYLGKRIPMKPGDRSRIHYYPVGAFRQAPVGVH